MNEPTSEARLFGREPSLTRLVATVNRAGREGSVAVVVGQAGIGKTSLVREALGRASLADDMSGGAPASTVPVRPATGRGHRRSMASPARSVCQHAREAAGDDRSLLSAIVTRSARTNTVPRGLVPVLLWDAAADGCRPSQPTRR